jgi:hypothetical protein
LNLSWSPIDYESIYFIISTAANTNKITISVSPYTYNLLGPSDFALASSKNITIELITTNYVEDKRLSAITTKGDGTKVFSYNGTYKSLDDHEFTSVILKSSTEGSTKKFRLVVFDDGFFGVEPIEG